MVIELLDLVRSLSNSWKVQALRNSSVRPREFIVLSGRIVCDCDWVVKELLDLVKSLFNPLNTEAPNKGPPRPCAYFLLNIDEY